MTANSVVTVLPTTIAPAISNSSIIRAGDSGFLSVNILLPKLVGRFTVSTLSLIPTGTPWRGPIAYPDFLMLSSMFALSEAPSLSKHTHARISLSSMSMFSKHFSNTEIAVRDPSLMPLTIS